MKKLKKCSKVCWDLLELTESQTEKIKKLTLKIKELESIIDSEVQQ